MEIITRASAKTAGLKRYFTGSPCTHGHVAERTVCDHACVECGRLKGRDPEVREQRREYMAAHQRNYRAKHPERVRATEQKRKHVKTVQRTEWRTKNPEKDRAALSRSFQKHKAKRVAAMRVWRSENKEANSSYQRVAKAKRRAAEGKFTRQDIERLMAEQAGKCAACHIDISADYHVDHIHPLARGGTNWPNNLQLLCGPCNCSKGHKTMAQWAAWKVEVTAGPRS